MRSTRSIEILCLALAALILVWSKALSTQTWPVLTLLGTFAIAIVAFRARRFFPRSSRTKLQIESWSMVIFITAVLWFTGKSSSPLLNLYLLPIILSALTLGRVLTLVQVAVVALCHLALAAATPGLDVASLVYASRAIGELAPFLLVAYLTTTLSADITEAREHIETLAQTDTLTGLANLRLFNEVWQRAHAACERDRGSYALLMIDMDKLKDINDSFGHEGGNLTTTLSADITEAREHIETLAQTDTLTGLANLRLFNEVWQRAHAACERDRGSYALLMIDMDKLKDINDSFGHEGGNSAILLVAQCLQRSIRGTDTAARFGGDEFAVLLPGASPEVAEAVIKRVRHNVYKTTLDLRSRMIRCSVSIGVVNYPKDGRDMRELLSIADRRMYRDKELRRAPGARANG